MVYFFMLPLSLTMSFSALFNPSLWSVTSECSHLLVFFLPCLLSLSRIFLEIRSRLYLILRHFCLITPQINIVARQIDWPIHLSIYLSIYISLYISVNLITITDLFTVQIFFFYLSRSPSNELF